MLIIKCKTCSQKWQGKDEYEAEVKMENNPCKCRLEAEKMTTEELLKKINETK